MICIYQTRVFVRNICHTFSMLVTLYSKIWTSSLKHLTRNCLMQDRDESKESLRKGLPVVSFSVGNSAYFLYGDERNPKKATSVALDSGDVLIFGGKSRHVFHGVPAIFPNSAPKQLMKDSCLSPGRLNLTFRQF